MCREVLVVRLMARASHEVRAPSDGTLSASEVGSSLVCAVGGRGERPAPVANWLGREQEKRMMRESKVQIEIPVNAAV